MLNKNFDVSNMHHKHKQLRMSINNSFNTVSVSPYSLPISNETSQVTTHVTHSDPWPTLARSTSLFLICCYNKKTVKEYKSEWIDRKKGNPATFLCLSLRMSSICFLFVLFFIIMKRRFKQWWATISAISIKEQSNYYEN
jgi:hypothetical protein